MFNHGPLSALHNFIYFSVLSERSGRRRPPAERSALYVHTYGMRRSGCCPGWNMELLAYANRLFALTFLDRLFRSIPLSRGPATRVEPPATRSACTKYKDRLNLTRHVSSPPDQRQSAGARALGSYAQCSASARLFAAPDHSSSWSRRLHEFLHAQLNLIFSHRKTVHIKKAIGPKSVATKSPRIGNSLNKRFCKHWRKLQWKEL